MRLAALLFSSLTNTIGQEESLGQFVTDEAGHPVLSPWDGATARSDVRAGSAAHSFFQVMVCGYAQTIGYDDEDQEHPEETASESTSFLHRGCSLMSSGSRLWLSLIA